MKRKIRKYAGKESKEFWDRVEKLPWQESGQAAWVLGCALQNLESFVMNYLENAEMKLRPSKMRAVKRTKTKRIKREAGR